MIDRTREDIIQDKRLDKLEAQPQSASTTPVRLDALEAKVAELEAKLAPFDNVAKFIQELRFRGHLPNIVGF